MQEDLSDLLFRNLQIVNREDRPISHAVENTLRADELQEGPKPEHPPIKYSITQHYHHSAHLAASAPSTAPSSPGLGRSPTDRLTAERMLESSGVNPSNLFPSQIALFQQSDTAQQRRLVELWQISPPTYGGHALADDLGTWPETSIRQEEMMAKLRLERRALDQSRSWGYSGSHDSSMKDGLNVGDVHGPTTPPTGSWNSGERCTAEMSQGRAAEPYIMDGYSRGPADAGGYVQSIDPVYQRPEFWEEYLGQQDMECQYGALEQMRHHGSYSDELSKARDGEDEEML